MTDLIDIIMYKNRVKTYLKQKLNENIKGYIHLTETNDNLQVDVILNGQITFTYTIEYIMPCIAHRNLTIEELNLIVNDVSQSYQLKIFSKYFKKLVAFIP